MMEYKKLVLANEINQYTESLKKNHQTTIAMDFEGEFNLHVYGEKLCLIQIYDGVDSVIIDPVDADMAAVKRLFEDEKILKIMWDAQSDISLIVNGYDMTIKSVLDLRPAADLLELAKRDYASVCAELLGEEKKINKSKFQKYNWLRRPIDDEAVLYALNDVLHLHKLKDVILSRLFNEGKLEEYIRLNMIIQNRNYVRVPGQRHKKMKGYRYMNKSEQHMLKTLFDLRDGYARRLNWPPHRVIPNPDLLELAKDNLSADRVKFDRNINQTVKREISEAVRDVLDS